ncbi:MAG TPA: 3'-5' exonuclease [Acetobacteraceae bacterium]|nr:3'-5' exonuclease [Acetobacteraceae bacterium]
MSGLFGRLVRGMAARLAAPPAAFLRARRHFHARLPDGPLAAQRYVVFDLESTGLAPSRGDAIVSIGAVMVRDAAPGDAFHTLVNPGRPIPAASRRYHGISDAMVADAPGEAEAVARFREFCGDAVLVAHNAAFDSTLLHMAEFRGAPAVPNPILCSQVVSRWLDPEERDHSLDGLCGRLEIVISGRHDALGDARATAALWVHLLARAAARGVEHLPELVRRTGMERAVAQAAEMF